MNFRDLLEKLQSIEEAKSPKAKKDWDKDGKIESEKDEVIGSRRKAAGLDESWDDDDDDDADVKKADSELKKHNIKLPKVDHKEVSIKKTEKDKEEELDEAVTSAPPVAPTKDDSPNGAGAGDESVEECGGDMGPEAPRQADNVTMNVTMNGTGAGGIKDLMDILRKIEQGGGEVPAAGHDHNALFGDGYENAAPNSSEEEMLGVDAVTNIGSNDGRGDHEALKVNGGGNPMRESLVAQLQSMYEGIKNR